MEQEEREYQDKRGGNDMKRLKEKIMSDVSKDISDKISRLVEEGNIIHTIEVPFVFDRIKKVLMDNEDLAMKLDGFSFEVYNDMLQWGVLFRLNEDLIMKGSENYKKNASTTKRIGKEVRELLAEEKLYCTSFSSYTDSFSFSSFYTEGKDGNGIGIYGKQKELEENN
jgi:hypothetical protein